MTRNTRRGNMILETAMLVPLMVLLLVGIAQIAKVTYLYYTLRKTVYSVATYLSAQQGVNFCDPADPTVQGAIAFGLTGTLDAAQPVFVNGLTASMIAVAAQHVDPATGALSDYTSLCVGSPAWGGSAPDFITVSIPNGFQIQLRIPFLPLDPILLKPQVKVPYAGT